jgi:hypothetical protein
MCMVPDPCDSSAESALKAWPRTTLVRRARRDGCQTVEGWCMRKNCDARAEAEPSNPRASDSRWNYRGLLLPEAQCR